jgi:hypothetical protein
MPYIKYNGEPIYFDTLEEARDAIDKLSGGKPKAKSGTSADGVWTAARFKDYTGRLSQSQLKLLQELVKSPEGSRTAKDLASVAQFKGDKAFGPVLAAMSKHAKKAGLSFDKILKSERKDIGNDSVLVFTAAPSFIKIAEEQGWKVSD